MQSLTKTVILFLLDLCYQTTTSAAIDVSIARALPIADVALNASPILTVQSAMKLHCLRECTRYGCMSFNFGLNICEIFDTFVCEDVGALEGRPGFRHYDVLNGSLIQFVDSYTHLTDCTVQGRCSPRCYLSTTSSTSTTMTPTPSTSTTTVTSTSTSTSTTAVTTLAPTTSTNSPTTTSTTTTNPPTTTTTTSTNPPTTTSTTSTNPPTTTTTSTNPPTTTTTTATNPPTTISTTFTNSPTTTSTTSTNSPTTTTTTSTNPPTTTTTTSTNPPTTTTAAPTTSTTTATPITPIACSTNEQCTVTNSNCRNGVICECEAGFSFHPASGTCVTSCPFGYGNSFHKTAGNYLFSLDMATIPNSSPAACQSQCAADNSCASFEFDSLLGDCTLSSSTKYGNEDFWFSDMFLDYYQRDCA